MFALLAVAVLSATPVDVAGQTVLAGTTVFLFVLVGWIDPTQGPLRIFMFLLTVFTSMRYMLWRAAETLPSEGFLAMGFGAALFGAELYGFAILLLSTFLSVDPPDREPEPAPLAADDCPTVDILIPSYNEADDLLEVTVRAAKAVNYPAGRVNVYLLDDGGTVAKRTQKDAEKAKEAQERHETLKALCERTGASYLTREKNDHAKAGNVNSALKQTNGELVLILDADHVPTADILTRTVGYFTNDPKLFLVQTPHFFLNPDPLEKNLDTFKDMPSENEMFYSVIQKGLDGFNASFFCGSAAVLRREYLMEIGGIQGETITEDAETALELHGRGYNSAYVAQPMVAGLAPETFTGFIVQRMRWAQGMVQIFLLKNPLLKSGLTIAQRLCYMNSCFFWFFPLARMAFIMAPLVYLLFGVPIYSVELGPFLAYGLPHIVGAVLLSATLYGRTRWILVSELYEVIQSVHCAGAILQVFRNPRAPTFAVTPKGENLDNAFISPLAKPFYVLIAILILGQIGGIIRWITTPEDMGYIVSALTWNTLHLILMVGALGVLFERSQRREFPRIEIEKDVHILVEDEVIECRSEDISVTGMGVRISKSMAGKIEVGDTVSMDALDLGAVSSSTLDMRVQAVIDKGDYFLLGLIFKLENAEQWKSVISLVYSRSRNWKEFQSKRSTKGNVFGKIVMLQRLVLNRATSHINVIFNRGSL